MSADLEEPPRVGAGRRTLTFLRWDMLVSGGILLFALGVTLLWLTFLSSLVGSLVGTMIS
jgi:hypothetical protein